VEEQAQISPARGTDRFIPLPATGPVDLDGLLIEHHFAKDAATAAVLRELGIARLRISLKTGERTMVVTVCHDHEPWALTSSTSSDSDAEVATLK
jgi:hypothetical protein